jgi:hypothetical protein
MQLRDAPLAYPEQAGDLLKLKAAPVMTLEHETLVLGQAFRPLIELI